MLSGGSRRCDNGHDVPPGDEYCGVCGDDSITIEAEAAPPALVEVTCSNLHSNPDGATVCLTCGEPLTLEVALCPAGHANDPSMTFCTDCGERIGSTPVSTEGWDDDHQREAPDDDPPPTDAARSARWPLWVAGALAILFLVGGIAARVANERDAGDGPTAENDAIETVTTKYGCEIISVRGLDATQVDPPYCTHVHLIEEYCGWTLDEVGYPPETGGGTIRFERVGGAYESAMFSVRAPGTQSEAFLLQCTGGPNTGVHEWTRSQWSALDQPA